MAGYSLAMERVPGHLFEPLHPGVHSWHSGSTNHARTTRMAVARLLQHPMPENVPGANKTRIDNHNPHPQRGLTSLWCGKRTLGCT